MAIRFFLSSSTEQLLIAKALEENLEAEKFEPTLWVREGHSASQYNLESLFKQAGSSDFAVFIFTPDDEVKMRDKTFNIVRDNVLFELGVFMGILGRERCFIVHSEEEMPEFPTDLKGINTLTYKIRSDDNLSRSLGPATTKIKNLAYETSAGAISKLTNNDLKLLQACKYTSMPSNQAYKAFGSMPEVWDDKLCMRFVRLLQHGVIKRAGATEIESTEKGKLLLENQRNRQIDND